MQRVERTRERERERRTTRRQTLPAPGGQQVDRRCAPKQHLSAARMQFDASLLEVNLNSTAIKAKAKQIQAIALACDDQSRIRDLVFAIQTMDMSTLKGDDTAANCGRLVWRALHPLSPEITTKLASLGIAPVTTAVVLCYTARTADLAHYLAQFQGMVPICTAVSGFPAGQGTVESTLEEVKVAVKAGASEIDIVINRTLALNGKWRELYGQIVPIAELCHQLGAPLKVIISTGELVNLENVYKASMVAMMAGADFIKTSTGKESVPQAKMVYGLVMTRAIRDFYLLTGRRVGLKPAGGLKDGNDALYWITLMRTQLGASWLTKALFRIGASSMLSNIEAELYALTHDGAKATSTELSF